MSDAAEAHGVFSVQTAPLPAQSGLCDALHAEIPAYGPRPSYLQSSQAQHWMYSPAELTRMRQTANQQATSALAAYAKESGVRDLADPGGRTYLLERRGRACDYPVLLAAHWPPCACLPAAVAYRINCDDTHEAFLPT